MIFIKINLEVEDENSVHKVARNYNECTDNTIEGADSQSQHGEIREWHDYEYYHDDHFCYVILEQNSIG